MLSHHPPLMAKIMQMMPRSQMMKALPSFPPPPRALTPETTAARRTVLPPQGLQEVKVMGPMGTLILSRPATWD